MESTSDKIKRLRATAHYFGATAVGQLSVENGDLEVAGDPEVAQIAASLATMYFAMALDAEHFGDLPTPEVKLRSPDRERDTPKPDGDEGEPPAVDFETWCGFIGAMSSRSRRRVLVDSLSPRRRAWWDEQVARDPKWLAW